MLTHCCEFSMTPGLPTVEISKGGLKHANAAGVRRETRHYFTAVAALMSVFS
jgi:hypothetical protein